MLVRLTVTVGLLRRTLPTYEHHFGWYSACGRIFNSLPVLLHPKVVEKRTLILAIWLVSEETFVNLGFGMLQVSIIRIETASAIRFRADISS
jgi:hypothetical protein